MTVKYLVTGAAGSLGSNIVRSLLSHGQDVRGLVLPGDPTAKYLPKEVELCEGDVLNVDDLQRFFAVPADAEVIVVHAAGIVSTEWGYSSKVYDVNVCGTRNIVEQCLHARVRRLVYISSVHAIPELPKGQTITEISSFDPDAIVGFYGKAKAEASQIVMDAVRERNLDAVIIFPTGMCGPGDFAGYASQLLIDCANSKLPVGIQGGYDFADVRDVAEGIVTACELGRKGEGYIMGNRYISIKEMLQLVHEINGGRLVKCMVPPWVARIALPFYGVYYKVKKKRPIFNRYALYAITSNSVFSSEKAQRELGYKVRPFRETISDTIKWLDKVGKLQTASSKMRTRERYAE